MIDLSEVIVALWFYPALAMIFVLIVAIFGVLFSLLKVFKPVAGQKRKPIPKDSMQEMTP